VKTLLFLISFFLLTIGVLAKESDFEIGLQSGKQYLSSWRVSEASQAADRILRLAESPHDKAQAYFFKAQVELYKSNYVKARELGEKAHALLPTDKEVGSFLDYILQVAKNGESFEEVKTEHFIVRYSHSTDSILLSYAEQVLERVYYEIGLDLESYPTEPVVVEIYPNLESFTLASTLSENDIKTTGVVGICKFNRIMILSPRLLPQGYTWFDTLAHEYTHYLIFLKSGNTVPVWLHEGIAKFEEKRWKEKKRNVLNPFYETLLAKALRANNLVPIEKMHPSLGKLSSAYEAQLAFAQVGTIVDFLVEKWGNNSLVDLLNNMREKNDYKVAIKEVTKKNFADFYDTWIKDLRSRNLKERIPQVKVKELRFEEKRAGSKDQSGDLVELDDAQARNYTRLGDMLRTRGRLKGATYEYEKALHFDPLSPIILNRLASTLSAYGEYDKAKEKLTPLFELHPEYLETYTNLGKIYLEKGNLNKAEEAYTQAISINPFNPEIHMALISIYKKLGRTDLEEFEKKVLNTLLEEDINSKQPINEKN
jgi:tetratricopeptide (TPR) repeat protein